MDTASRVLRLLSLLTTRRSWRGEELAERLGVTDRTVRRDVERLRELGYPVHAVPGPTGGYALGAGARLPPLQLDDDSAVAVALGVRAAATGAVAGMEESALRALAAIEQVMPTHLQRRVTALRSAIVPLAADGPTVAPAVLAVLALACRDGERLRFGYVDRTGAQTRRHVEPHRVVHTGRRWYLVARDVDRDGWRSFRVDRMREPTPTGARGHPEDPPDAARFVTDALSLRPYRWHARLLIEAPAEVVAGLVPPTAAAVEALDDRRCVLVTGADSLDAIVLHTALLDLPFTPLEPPELAERCAALAERLRAAAGLLT
ncbi:helix-turn-helix transcriptional regulator [Pseudonocardia acaciae]|uniref:helix-turn-helix transcriptional regulator n=1 Tax=Pseudonocardia acaciae TaxID=551276 RepID=UPI0005655E86|nr:WYL domain-containing protein [Pseudonocardia acaciae]